MESTLTSQTIILNKCTILTMEYFQYVILTIVSSCMRTIFNIQSSNADLVTGTQIRVLLTYEGTKLRIIAQ